jgi:TetR/AcrR family transcriptional regulator
VISAGGSVPGVARAGTETSDPTDRVTRPSADPTRDRILAVAVDLFSERSFKDATTREIAQQAGVTQPLLNYHFRSKDDLWRAAMDTLFGKLGRSMDERAQGLRGVDPVDRAKLLVREFITFSARNPQLHRIITQECKFDGPRMDYLVERYIRPVYDSTIAMFEQLVAVGAAPPIAPPHLYYILTGAGPSMFVLGPECRRLTGLDPESDEVIEAHADAVCRLLFGEPNAPS